jgi:hypothetical protein
MSVKKYFTREEKRIANNNRARQKYAKMKDDPNFLKHEREKAKKLRLEKKNGDPLIWKKILERDRLYAAKKRISQGKIYISIEERLLMRAERESLITYWVKKYPLNIKYAFMKCAEELSTTKNPISWRTIQGEWYSRVKNKTIILTCGSQVGFSKNVKNLLVDENGNLPSYNFVEFNNIIQELNRLIIF